MTKKSFARLQRDAEEKKVKDARQEVAIQIEGNTVYDEIHGIYQQCGLMLAGYAESFNQLKVGDALPRFSEEQKTKVGTLVSGFQTDIRQLQTDLIGIRAPFKELSGGETNVDRFIETIGVVDQFQEFINRSKGVLDPTFRDLSAEVGSVVQLLPQQDPSVITDVQVKNENVSA